MTVLDLVDSPPRAKPSRPNMEPFGMPDAADTDISAADQFVATLKRLGMSQRDFAAYTEVTPRSINRWATGEIEPPAYIWRLLQLMERQHVAQAPARPTASQATQAIAPALAAIVADAVAKQWPREMVLQAIRTEADTEITVATLDASNSET